MDRYKIDRTRLPAEFPTHKHRPDFWTELGRTVATFGFLEEVLGKAIFAFTGTRQIAADGIEAEFEKWLPTLQKALSDPLGGLIDVFGKAVRSHERAAITNLDDLLSDLRKAAVLRNVICHGSWRSPDDAGKSIPFYVDTQNRLFQTPVDVAYLTQLRHHAVDLISAVVDTVTTMGFRFPGSKGPGITVS